MWKSFKTVAPTPNSAIIQIDVDDNFVINSTHLKMIQENKFDGYMRAGLHDHIREFLVICDMFKYGETQSEAVKLLIFPFSMCGEAKFWFNELNEESITSWEQMRKAFINKFFPPSLFNRLLLEIGNFSQESLKEEMHEMRKNYNNRGGDHASRNDDTSMHRYVVSSLLDMAYRMSEHVMGEPLSPDRVFVFDFPVDEPKPHPAYDFFAPGPLPGYAGNPNNNNGWIEAGVPLLGELGVVDRSVVDMDDGPLPCCFRDVILRMMTLTDWDLMRMSRAVTEVEEVSNCCLSEGNLYPLPTPGRPIPSFSDRRSRSAEGGAKGQQTAPREYELIDGLNSAGAGALIGSSFASREITQNYKQLQTIVLEMSSWESTLMQCILGMDRRLADLEKRPPGPQ
ncbi:reverse transcriptase domain-containing protein [Tanacetum coccineum]